MVLHVDMWLLSQKSTGLARSFFCHFISANMSSVRVKKSDTLLPCSSRSVVMRTMCFVSTVRYSQISGIGKTICSMVRSCRTICQSQPDKYALSYEPADRC